MSLPGNCQQTGKKSFHQDVWLGKKEKQRGLAKDKALRGVVWKERY